MLSCVYMYGMCVFASVMCIFMCVYMCMRVYVCEHVCVFVLSCYRLSFKYSLYIKSKYRAIHLHNALNTLCND